MNQHPLALLMAERIASGLKRRSLTTCSRWAEAIRIMGKPFPGPWTFKWHPWLREMHDTEAEMNVGQKAAQMGFTEWALNVTFFHIDVKNVDCLYVLPTKTPDAGDFSAARFDPALELSPHLSTLFSDVKNVGHKRAGNTNLYIRGSKSRPGLKSIPVGLIVLDEVDEMMQENVPLALERTAGQIERAVLSISTPTIPKVGINKLYIDSTEEHFFFRCPHCLRFTELIFPQCLEITAVSVTDESIENSYIKCKECGLKLDHETKHEWLGKGKWVPSYTNRSVRGFHVSQLYSSTVSPANFAKSYLRSLRDNAEEQEFYNSKLGLAHVVEGAGVSDKDLDECLGQYISQSAAAYRAIRTLGIDVGKWIHYEVDEWHIPGDVNSVDLNARSHCRVVNFGKVLNFEELDRILMDFNVNACVIDANPERRKSFEFASRFWGYVKMCFYGQGVRGKRIHIGSENEENTSEPVITVDRTSWLDLSLGRFKNRTIQIPTNISQEYRNHIKSPIRVYEKDKNGNPVGRYVSNDDDHYAHARNYSEMALQLALNMAQVEDVESPL